MAGGESDTGGGVVPDEAVVVAGRLRPDHLHQGASVEDRAVDAPFHHCMRRQELQVGPQRHLQEHRQVVESSTQII